MFSPEHGIAIMRALELGIESSKARDASCRSKSSSFVGKSCGRNKLWLTLDGGLLASLGFAGLGSAMPDLVFIKELLHPR